MILIDKRCFLNEYILDLKSSRLYNTPERLYNLHHTESITVNDFMLMTITVFHLLTPNLSFNIFTNDVFEQLFDQTLYLSVFPFKWKFLSD